MTRFRQTLTAEQDDHLHRTAFNARKASKTVTVDKAALEALLVDHGRALAALPRGYDAAAGRQGPR